MNHFQDDWHLLRDYLDNGSQAAFASLVERHVNLVYSTCLREVRDPTLAEDVTQVVFLILARKAAAIRPGTLLSGWLFNTSRFASKNALKQEVRRQRREQKIAQEIVGQTMMSEVQPQDGAWAQLEPLLHDALASLSREQRNAIILRFFEGKSVRETGERLGISENAAEKRLSRALEKLRRYFAQQGCALTVAALTALIAERAVHAAPVGCTALAMNIAHNVAAGGSVIGTSGAVTGTTANVSTIGSANGIAATNASLKVASISEGVLKAMLMSQIKVGVVTSLGLCVAGSGVGKVAHMAIAAAQQPSYQHISSVASTETGPIKPTSLAVPGLREVNFHKAPNPHPLSPISPKVALAAPDAYAPVYTPVKWSPVTRLTYPRMAEADAPVPAPNAAGAEDKSEFKLQSGEILLQGKIRSVTLDKKLLTLEAASYALPNGKTNVLPQPKTKLVLLDEQTLLYARGGNQQKISLADLTDVNGGVCAIAIGKDEGSGKALPARTIAVWDRVEGGVYHFKDDQLAETKAETGTSSGVGTSSGAVPDNGSTVIRSGLSNADTLAPTGQSATGAQAPANLEQAKPEPAITGQAASTDPLLVAQSRFPDGTFENLDATGQPVRWHLPMPRNSKIMEENGNHFLRLTADPGRSAVWIESNIKIDPTWKTLLIRSRMRTQNVGSGPVNWGSALLEYDFEDEAKNGLGYAEKVFAPRIWGNTDWVTRQAVLTIAPGTAQLKLQPLLLASAGTADFDDIYLEPNAPLEAPPIRPGFPEGKFEKLDASGTPEGWMLTSLRQEQVLTENGNRFLRLTQEVPLPYSLIADSRFQLDPSWQALKIRARLRGHNITVGNQIWMTAHIAYDFDDKDGNKVESGPTRFLGLRQDSDWVTQEITARIPAGATFLRLKPGLFRVKGTFDIADLDISEVTLPASLRALAIRPGFPEGTFEQFDNQHNPLGWKLPDPVQMKVLTENGNHFLRLTNDTSLNSVSLESRFQLDPRWQAIKVRVRMRTSDLNPGPNPQDRAQLRFDFSDTNQQKVGPGHTVPTLKGDSDWTTLESKVLVPQGAAFITLIPGLFHTTGTLDVDDISIEEVKTQ